MKHKIKSLCDNKLCDIFLGITNPNAFDLDVYAGYDIQQLKGYARFLEVVLGRDGESNALIGLYFDGATGYYTPLPSANDVKSLQKVYNLIAQNQSIKLSP